MLKHKKSLIVAAAITAALSGCASKFVANADETTVRSVVSRWAEQEGLDLRWEIADLGVIDSERDTLNAILGKENNLSKSLGTLLTVSEAYRHRAAKDEGASKPLPVEVCIYSNTITVKYLRTVALPCSQQVGTGFEPEKPLILPPVSEKSQPADATAISAPVLNGAVLGGVMPSLDAPLKPKFSLPSLELRPTPDADVHAPP